MAARELWSLEYVSVGGSGVKYGFLPMLKSLDRQTARLLQVATTSCRSELLGSTEQQASSVQVRLPGRQVRVKAAQNPTAKGPVQASEATFAPIFPGGQRQEWVPRVSFRAARMIPAHANWALPESFFAMPVIGESRGLGVLRGGRAGCSSLEKCAACPGCCR